MQVEADLSGFFGHQERSKGSEIARKDLVLISSASDTDVRALIKGSQACRVTLTADEVAAASFSCACTCPQSRKGDLCKHVWAVLLKLEEKEADFLDGKTEALAPVMAAASPSSEARLAQQTEFKSAQKLKLKERNKQIRQNKKAEKRGTSFQYPAPVQESLDYFVANGFTFDELDMPSLQNARKLLSRVFHPDKGGTHDEVLELNSHFETLADYLR